MYNTLLRNNRRKSIDPFMYCSYWIDSSETLPVGDMSSQRTSELLQEIRECDRSAFFEQWARYRSEREYLALDITSISSWSNLIEDVDWGYNRDNGKLAQINLCLLMGEKSRLPVFHTVYNGSLKDVSTLKATIKRATCYLNSDEPILIVMDKGFYSKKNIDEMLIPQSNIHFVIPVPFTVKFAKQMVQSEKKDIDCVANTIVSGADTLRGVSKRRSWDTENRVYTHIYYNAMKSVKRKNDLYGHVATLKQYVESGKNADDFASDVKKYLIVRSSTTAETGHTISYREDVIENELETSGWMVLISNKIEDCGEALEVYRAKDVVEKGFYRLKNSIDLGRLRVHSQDSMQSKVFVGFLSLILLSYTHRVMLEKKLYADMTLKEMLLILKAQRIQYINEHRIVFPTTKKQRLIYEAFGFREPV
jgi:transposase